jgi:hypothetical protein
MAGKVRQFNQDGTATIDMPDGSSHNIPREFLPQGAAMGAQVAGPGTQQAQVAGGGIPQVAQGLGGQAQIGVQPSASANPAIAQYQQQIAQSQPQTPAVAPGPTQAPPLGQPAQQAPIQDQQRQARMAHPQWAQMQQQLQQHHQRMSDYLNGGGQQAQPAQPTQSAQPDHQQAIQNMRQFQPVQPGQSTPTAMNQSPNARTNGF